jgi:ABC-2 type transport system ATP-binding protein
MSAAVVVEDLHKSYGAVPALRGVSFVVGEGEVFALLGPNGAGKTTAIEILEGFRSRDGGRVSVLGTDPQHAGPALRDRLGIVLQSCGFDPYLTVTEALRQRARWYQRALPVDEIVTLVGLEEKGGARIGRLSGGQQRRLDLALALIGDPSLLFLDEPTTGFDPSARRQAWLVIRQLCQLGKTVVLTTHYLEEAHALAERVAIVVAGRIVAEGPPDTLAHRDDTARISFRLPPSVELSELPLAASAHDGLAHIETRDVTATMHELTHWATTRRLELAGLDIDRPSLEDVYLELTADAAR